MIVDLINLLFPRICVSCNNTLVKNETYFCLHCSAKLPKTNFHLNPDNQVAQIFWGRVLLQNASAFYFFEKGNRVQKFIHKIKYKNNTDLAQFCGKLIALEMGASYFHNMDIIMPVPMHKTKQRIRGFNQAEIIGKGIAEAINKPIITNLLCKTEKTITQTRKNRFDRWQNAINHYSLEETINITNKHILLVDDVITTGATIEACAQKLLEHEGVKVSVLTLAYAKM